VVEPGQFFFLGCSTIASAHSLKAKNSRWRQTS
jgi:hypothetical protein